MKASRMKLILLTLSLLFTNAIKADVLEQETYLSNHLTDVIKSYDTRGVVRVDIETKGKKLELPGTNFIVNSNLIGGVDKGNVKSLTVNVFTELKEMPVEFKNYIDTKTNKYTDKANIKFIPLAKQVNGLEEKIGKSLDKVSDSFGSSNLIYGLLTIPFAIFMIAWFFKGQLNQATQTMGSELQNLTSALQEQGIGTSPEALAIEASSSEGSSSDQSSTVLEQNMWEMMNEEFYVGLIWDCYWCLEDNYASFVWSKAPVELKRELLSSGKVDEDYIKFVSDLKPTDKAFGTNSYYLKPWGYNHISNPDLSSLIIEDKRLFSFISPMRLTKLELSLEEKLECIQASGTASKMKEEFFVKKIENMKESQKREFDSGVEFEFASFEEENQLVKMDIDLNVMKKFPTLGWILKLSDEKIINILSSFQAKELASALYTSEEIKKDIISKLPEKRRELIESYAQKSKGAKNKTYTSIMKMVYAELEETHSQKPELKEVKSA